MQSPRRPPIDIALIGAGVMGSLHARVVTQSQQATLACVVDPDEQAGRRLGERFNIRWQQDVDDWGAYDGVIVASPTGTHYEWASRVVEAEVPLLVEKPMTDSLKLTAALVDDARSRGVPMTSGFVERFNPTLMTAVEIVEEPVYLRSIRHSPYAPRIETGVAEDLLIHDVDIAITMMGQMPCVVSSMFSHCHPSSIAGAEDIADVHLGFAGGAFASLSASRISQRKLRQVTIAMIDKAVEIDLVRQDITVFRHVGNMMLDDEVAGYRQETVIDIPVVKYYGEPLALQFEHFVALARGDIDPAPVLDTLLPPHQVIDRARASAESGSRESLPNDLLAN